MKADSHLPLARIGIVVLMVLYSVLSYFDRTIMSVAGPGMIHDFGLSETQMGAVYSAFFLGYAIFMVPGGELADRLGPWRTLAAMGAGAGIFTATTAVAGLPSLGIFGVIPLLLMVRFLMGVVTAPLYPSCGKMNANWFAPSRQGFVWGLIAGGAGVGSALSPSLFAWMLPALGWRRSFSCAAAATLALAALWSLYARDRESQQTPVRIPRHIFSRYPENTMTNDQVHLEPHNFWALLRNRNVLLLSFGYLTVGYFEYIFFFWIYYYFGEIRHMTPKETSSYTTAIFLAWVVMSPIGGILSDLLVRKLGPARGRPIVPVVGVLGGAVLLFWGIRLANPLAVGAALALSFGLASSSDGAFWKATIEAGGDNVGAACGILNTGSNVGGFIAPVLTPWIASFAGWSFSLNIGCLLAAIGAAIWFFLRPVSPTAQNLLMVADTVSSM